MWRNCNSCITFLSMKNVKLILGIIMLAPISAAVSLRFGAIDWFTAFIYGIVVVTSALFAAFANFVIRRNLPAPWNLSLLVGSIAYALTAAGLYISIGFFPQSSTAPLGLLTAPIIASFSGLLFGGLVHALYLLRRKS